jgi:guanidinopropionase
MTEVAEDLKPIFYPEVARHVPTFTILRARQRETPQDLDVALCGVPADFTTTQRPGSRYGPSQVREYSRMLRIGHAVTRVMPFDLCRIADIGDATVMPLNVDETIASIEAFFRRIVEAGALPLAIGGEHTITLPILRALAAPPRGPIGVVHFDAHPDTIYEMDGNFINTGTPFRRSVEEGLTDPKRHVMIGIRGTMYDTEAFDWARDQGMTIIGMDELEEMTAKGVVAKIKDVMGDGLVYVTVDLDGLDPAAVPGTNYPEPGGVTVRDAQIILRGLRGLRLVGADVNELNPLVDPTGNSAIVVVNLMFELLCVMAEARAQGLV